MAARAAKFGHCQIRPPVEYRWKAPFRPEIVAPLDFAIRAQQIYAHDRELDRAVMTVSDFEQLLLENVASGRGPVGLFVEDDLAPRSSAFALPPRTLSPVRQQFLRNALRIAEENARFRPPWTDTLLEEVHAVLMTGLGTPGAPGVFRTEPYTGLNPEGEVLYFACPPERIRAEVQGLLEWVDRMGPSLMPVIPATILLQGLHSIRPFAGGSMTVARAMATLYLRHHGLPNAELVPIASAALATPSVLLRLLLWSEATGSYTELVDYTLDAVLKGYSLGVQRWLVHGVGAAPLDEVALRLLSKARRTPGWFSAREATLWVGGRGDATVLRHLNRLVSTGSLESSGYTRGKRYRFVSPRTLLPELRRRIEATKSARTPHDRASHRRRIVDEAIAGPRRDAEPEGMPGAGT